MLIRCGSSAGALQSMPMWHTRVALRDWPVCRETEPNWDEDIEKDVKEECGKYGAVNHAHVDKNSKVSHSISPC